MNPLPPVATRAFLFLAASALVAVITVTNKTSTYIGHVVDQPSGTPIAGAVVTLGETVALTDSDGSFQISGQGNTIHARAAGYLRSETAATSMSEPDASIPLTPFQPKALYLSHYGIGSAKLRAQALELIDATELNALVIDVKGDRGRISYQSEVPLAAAVGAIGLRTIPDVPALLSTLRARGIYTIARIVVFKDAPLATARPDFAVRTDGAIWRDREHLPWTDPFRQEVWDYNIDLAVEAAASGFDEIQFDYVRFPDAKGVSYSQKNTPSNRMAAIGGFLAAARRRLVSYNVFLSADIFGYVCWNLDDTMIGQKIEQLAPHLDYVSPMLYPSSFQFGIPGYHNPVAHPYEIVYQSLERARRRTGLPPTRFRPWLQAFKDYAFDRRPFESAEIRAQIRAAEDFGSAGWMLWNPHNRYSAGGLRENTPN